MTVSLRVMALAVAALGAAAPLQAQRLEEARFAVPSFRTQITSEMSRVSVAARDTSPNVGLMILSGVLLGGAGTVVGGLAGLGIDQRSCAPGDDFCGLGGLVVGAFIGEAFALPLGVHLAGRRKGPYGAEVLAAFGISALGVAAAFGTNGYALALIPPLQLWASIALERRWARQGR